MIIPEEKEKPIVVLKIIQINGLIFVAWNLIGLLKPEFMINNFLVSWSSLNEGRYWTLVTSVFSHNLLFHILINMYVFYGFGVVLEKVLGHRKFLIFFLMAGIMGSLAHVLVSRYLLHDSQIAALGASGAVAGIALLFSLIYPRENVYIFGLIPVPSIFATLIIIGLDLWGLIEQTQGVDLPIGYGAHLGGALYAVIYYFLFARKKLNQFFDERNKLWL